MLVYVINKHGKPLMPCSAAKARRLLRDGKAKVIRREPFTIRLNYGSSGYRQPVTLGVDAGSVHIGLSASTAKQELYSSDVQLRYDVVELLATRRELRRRRRGKKTRYRPNRFSNRKNITVGWLSPSTRNKIDAHLKVVDNISKILSLTKIIVETASFDVQKIKNPDISGVEYQQGEQFNFRNVREYILFRDGHECMSVSIAMARVAIRFSTFITSRVERRAATLRTI